MDMNYISNVEKEIKSSGEESFITGGVSDAKIMEFESLLGVKFPESYKCFLKAYGALSFCGDTYYGITQKGKEENQVPCVLFSTLDARSRGDISERMIKVKSSGYGPYFSLDLDILGQNGEPAVVETELSFKSTGDKKIISESYGDFLLMSIREAIEDI
jgi:hypothetical protein